MSGAAYIRQIVAEMLAQQAQSRPGTVSAVDPVNGLVRVTIDEGDPASGSSPTQTGWLPVAQVAAGKNWGLYCLPPAGMQVRIEPDMGDAGNMVVTGAIHSTAQPPAQIIPYKATDTQPLVPGEPTIVFADGTYIRLTEGGPQIRGTLKVDGDLIVSGNISDLDGQRGTLDVLRSKYDDHHHTGVQPGGGLTGTTDDPTP